MKKKYLPLLLIAYSFFLNFKATTAQVFAGGEIYYELIAAKKYKVTAHLYRMCDQAPLNTLNASVYGPNTVVAMNFQRIAISRINDTCGNPCDKQNAVSNPGFEKHTYTDTVDFNVAPYDVFVTKNICTVNFGIRQGGRYSGLTTLNSGVFYLDASVNICLTNITKNTSPRFSMEPKFLAACNMQMVYSPGPLDTMDNDSFNFSLASVQSNYNASVTYNGSFTPQIPMTPFCLPSGILNCKPLPSAKPPRGFYFDNLNGTINFTPINCSEIGMIKYKINEYRYNKQTKQHEWLGYVTREMMVQIIKSTNNNPPSIIPSTGNYYNVCEGSNLCIIVKTTDAKAPTQFKDDTTTLYWDNGIKDAGFSITNPAAREKEGKFCWQTKAATNRMEDYFFTVATYDKQCNLNLVSKTFNVKVNTNHDYTYKNSVGKCGVIKWEIRASDSLYPNYKPSATTIIRSLNTNTVLYSGTNVFDSVQIYENGKIQIEHTFNTYCPVIVRDTLTIAGAIPVPDINNNQNAIVCRNTMNLFHFSAYRIPNLKTFKWYLNDTLINQTDTILSVKISTASKIRLNIENKDGCVASRTLNYTLKQHNAISSIDQTVCPGALVTVQANNKTLASPVTYQWKINGVDTTVNDSNLNLIDTNNKKILLTVTDANQCVFTDSVIYAYWPSVSFDLSSEPLVCKDSLTVLGALNVIAETPFIYNWSVDNQTVSNNKSLFSLNPSKDVMVSLEITDKNLCSTKDSVVIETVKTPEVSLPLDIETCTNSIVTIVLVVTNRPAKFNYLWSFNKAILGIDSVLTRKISGSQLIKLKVSNELNCSTEDEINISTMPSVILAVYCEGNRYYHPGSFIKAGTTNTFATYLWFNGKTTANDSFWASELGPPGRYKIWCRTTDFYGCEKSDTIEIFTNKFLNVNQYNLKALNVYPNPVASLLNVESPESSTMVLYAMDGKILMQSKLLKGSNQIDMTQFSSGVYLLKMIVAGDESIMKIIKE